MRALSILLVLLHHAPAYREGSAVFTLQSNGRHGVAWFFVISGFLICTLLLREERKNGRIDLWKFYGRRALRLLPLYYAVLLLQAVLVYVVHQYTPENQALFHHKLPSYLLYYSNWLPTATQGPFFCSWSLAVEEQFYLGFSLLLLFAPRRWLVPGLIAVLLIKPLVWQRFGPADVTTASRILFSYREPILLGVLAAFALNTRRGYELCRRWLGSRWTQGLLAAALAVCFCLHAPATASSWSAEGFYLLMTLIMAGLVMHPRAPPVLGSRLVVHIGIISYGIYLLHMFVISAVKKIPLGNDPTVCFLLSTPVSILFASLVYRYFEAPIIRFYKRRFAPKGGETVSRPRESIAGLPAHRPASP